MTSPSERKFNENYKKHLQHLKLKGLQPKTIDAYSRAIRRIGKYFNHEINDISKQQLTDYFSDLLKSHSWSAVKLDLYGLKFYYGHVLDKPWTNINLIKPPKTQHLPDIITVEEAQRLFMATNKLSYRAFYFTLYSLGLRLGEGLRLEVGDIAYMEVGKGRELGAEALMLRAAGSISVIPRATKIAWCHCRIPRGICCGVFGRCTVTLCCYSPIATAD